MHDITFEKIERVEVLSRTITNCKTYIFKLVQSEQTLTVSHEWQELFQAKPGDLISVYHNAGKSIQAGILYRPAHMRYEPVKALTVEHHNIPLLVRFRAWLIKVSRSIYYGVKKHADQQKEKNDG